MRGFMKFLKMLSILTISMFVSNVVAAEANGKGDKLNHVINLVADNKISELKHLANSNPELIRKYQELQAKYLGADRETKAHLLEKHPKLANLNKLVVLEYAIVGLDKDMSKPAKKKYFVRLVDIQ
jgi:hypothetical protein